MDVGLPGNGGGGSPIARVCTSRRFCLERYQTNTTGDDQKDEDTTDDTSDNGAYIS